MESIELKRQSIMPPITERLVLIPEYVFGSCTETIWGKCDWWHTNAMELETLFDVRHWGNEQFWNRILFQFCNLAPGHQKLARNGNFSTVQHRSQRLHTRLSSKTIQMPWRYSRSPAWPTSRILALNWCLIMSTTIWFQGWWWSVVTRTHTCSMMMEATKTMVL